MDTEVVDLFLESLVTSFTAFADTAREEFAEFFQGDESIQMLSAEFLNTGDTEQLNIIAMRMRTFARTKNLQGLIAVQDMIGQAMLIAGTVAHTILIGA